VGITERPEEERFVADDPHACQGAEGCLAGVTASFAFSQSNGNALAGEFSL
jgi:hypothetical protein